MTEKHRREASLASAMCLLATPLQAQHLLLSPLLFLVPLSFSLTIQLQRARQSQAWPSHWLLKAEKMISLVPRAGCGEAAWFL